MRSLQFTQKGCFTPETCHTINSLRQKTECSPTLIHQNHAETEVGEHWWPVINWTGFDEQKTLIHQNWTKLTELFSNFPVQTFQCFPVKIRSTAIPTWPLGADSSASRWCCRYRKPPTWRTAMKNGERRRTEVVYIYFMGFHGYGTHWYQLLMDLRVFILISRVYTMDI